MCDNFSLKTESPIDITNENLEIIREVQEENLNLDLAKVLNKNISN